MVLTWCLDLVADEQMDMWLFVVFRQRTAYEMRISDWSSDVCSSDLAERRSLRPGQGQGADRRVPRGTDPHRQAEGSDPLPGRPSGRRQEIGRASCRERVCQYV